MELITGFFALGQFLEGLSNGSGDKPIETHYTPPTPETGFGLAALKSFITVHPVRFYGGVSLIALGFMFIIYKIVKK